MFPWAVASAVDDGDGRLPGSVPPRGLSAAMPAVLGEMRITVPLEYGSRPMPPPARPLVAVAAAAAAPTPPHAPRAAIIPRSELKTFLHLAGAGTFTSWAPPEPFGSSCGLYTSLVFKCFRYRLRPAHAGAGSYDDGVVPCSCRALVIVEQWTLTTDGGDDCDDEFIVVVRSIGEHSHVVDASEMRHFPRPSDVEAYHHNIVAVQLLTDPGGVQAYVNDYVRTFDKLELADAVAVRAGGVATWQRPSPTIALLPQFVPTVVREGGAYARTSKYGPLSSAEVKRLGRHDCSSSVAEQ